MPGRRWFSVRSVVRPFAAVALTVFVAVQANADPPAEDTSCHNPFHNRATNVIAPKLAVEVMISEDDWPELKALLTKFAERHDWSFRDGSVVIPDRVSNISLSACAESSLRILVSLNLWKNTHIYDRPGRGVPVILYGDVSPEQWQPVAREWIKDLETKWPGRVSFVDKDGALTNRRPEYLN